MVRCKDCKYSIVVETKRYCLRYPPSVELDNPATVGHKSVFPEVENNWRCGEGEVEA
jgi:hypothetical protein